MDLSHSHARARQERLDEEARLYAIEKEQVNKIIKDNKNDIIKTILLLNELDYGWCENWVESHYWEEQRDNNTEYWKFCVRKYLYDDKYFTDKTPIPDIIQNTQGWLDRMMVDGISLALGYSDCMEDMMDNDLDQVWGNDPHHYWGWLSSYELKMLDKRMTEWMTKWENETD